MNTAQVIVILAGVLAYLILMGCSLAFLTSCSHRSTDKTPLDATSKTKRTTNTEGEPR